MRTLVVTAVLVVAAAPSPLSGAHGQKSCAGAGPYWPTETLALTGGTAWVACKEEGRVVRLTPPSGPLRSTPLSGAPIALVAGLGAVWALDTGGVVSRLDLRNGKVTAKISTGSSAPYNLWIGDGSLWSVDDRAGTVVRIDPARRKVVARIPVGDGPADLVFRGERAWVINHRDLRLVLIDTATNRARKLARVPGDAPERIAWASGSLWVTGRGTDLLRLDPATGAVEATIEIGAGGIDVIAVAGSLWVPARAAAADQRGFPTMAALRRVDAATGKVSTPGRASRRVDVHGLVPYRGGVLFADNTGGRLYTVPS
jgi:YVTN family beta-propeller protein